MNKKCSFCNQIKDISEFFKNRKRYDGVQTYCKSCKLQKDHIYYINNKKKHTERVKRYLIRNKVMLWNYLKTHPCQDCGEKNPIVLEFDHKSAKTKENAVSFLANYSKCSWVTLLKEIKKCDIRCANCHRIKTAKQLGWYKYI